MHRFALTFVMLMGATAAQADDCASLGLSSSVLQEHFCAQLEALRDSKPVTRAITQSGSPDALPDDPWADLELIQDAYRADPRKTLELIERIKGAGGLITQVEN